MSDDVIDLRAYVALLLNRWWLILLITVVTTGSAYTLTLQDPEPEPLESVFQARSVVHMDGVHDLIFIPELAESRPVLEDVIQDLRLSLATEELDSKTTVFRIPATNLLQIDVQDPDPAMSAAIANGVARSFIDYIKGIRDAETEESWKVFTQLWVDLDADSSALTIDQVLPAFNSLPRRPYIILKAQPVAETQIKPVQFAPETNVSRNILLGLFLGVVLSVALIVSVEYIQNPVRSSVQFDRKFAFTRLGVVPRNKRSRNEKYLLAAADENNSEASEAIQQIAVNLAGVLESSGATTLALVIPSSEDSNSDFSANLGVALAGTWKNTVLVDADLRYPCLHHYFGITNEVGLSNFLSDPSVPVEDVVRETPYQRLKVISGGAIPDNPVELLSSPRLGQLMESLKSTADVLLIDTPPLLTVADGAVVGSKVDGVILMVDGSHCRAENIREGTNHLENAGATILGYVWIAGKASILDRFSRARLRQQRP